MLETTRSLAGLHRHAHDQWLRATQSIPLNIAESHGERSLKNRARFLDIARGSALECAAIQDVLVVSGCLNRETSFDLKSKLVRIVAMWAKMALKLDSVSESLSEYTLGIDYEHEHRDAEHEHEEEPEQSDRDRGPVSRDAFSTFCMSTICSIRNSAGSLKAVFFLAAKVD
jgi:four helix bundle protein